MITTELLMKTYSPEVAIVVYKSRYENDFYLESHDFNAEGELMVGKPLMEETIMGMIDVMFDTNQNNLRVSGIIPDNVILYSPLPGGYYNMIWYRPAEIRVIHFVKELKLGTGKAWVPPMLYVVKRKELSVFAMKKSTRPDLKTTLYRAPFHNVSDNGDVCLGSASVKKPKEYSYENLTKYWEDLFWLSEFSHLNGAENPVRSDLHKVWTRLLKSKTKLKWSDIGDELKRSPVSLKALIK
jgi:PRTRC genetic system protein B